jgi:hypothetical protein
VNATTISPNTASQLEKLHEQYGAYYVTGTVRIAQQIFFEIYFIVGTRSSRCRSCWKITKFLRW